MNRRNFAGGLLGTGLAVFSGCGAFCSNTMEQLDTDGTVGIYDGAGDLIRTVDGWDISQRDSPNSLKGWAFSPDCKYGATVYHFNSSSNLSVFDLETGDRVLSENVSGFYKNPSFTSEAVSLGGNEFEL